MANYQNLTSLAGLNVGDVVFYLSDTIVDPAGKSFLAELYGESGSALNNYGTGGYTTAIIDSCVISDDFRLSFIHSTGSMKSPSISYGSFSTYTACLYYRFLVAGACGSSFNLDGYLCMGGNGGGSTAGSSVGSSGGTTAGQTSGYSFGYGQTNGIPGGDGWYGGWSVPGTSISHSAGGGSGFIIGTTTTTYPSGYMGDDQNLIQNATNLIRPNSASTVRGGASQGSTFYDYSLIKITIVEPSRMRRDISYILNGGTNDSNNIREYIETQTSFTFLPATKQYYEFAGWYTDSSFTNQITEVTEDTTGDLTLYAKWTPIEYTQYFLDDIGNSLGSIQYNRDNYRTILWSDIPVPASKLGYNYYWLGDNGTRIYPHIGDLPVADFDLLQFIDGFSFTVEYYLVKYYIYYRIGDPFNYTRNDSFTVNDLPVTLITSVVLDNKYYRKFTNWYSNEDLTGEPITEITVDDIEYLLGDTLTFYGKTVPIDFKIEYELNGGSQSSINPNPELYNVESEKIIFSNPYKKRFIFEGWYLESSFKNKVEYLEVLYGAEGGSYEGKPEFLKFNDRFQTSTISDIKLYAKFVPIMISIGNYKTSKGYQSVRAYRFNGTTWELLDINYTDSDGFKRV